MWHEPADRTSPTPDAPEDVTPETGSPVDLDSPPPPARPTAPPPASQAPAARTGPRRPGWWQRTTLGFPIWIVLAFVAVVIAVFAVIALSGDPGTESTDRLQTVDSAVTTAPLPVAPTTTTASTTVPTTTLVAVTPTAIFTIPTDPPTSVAETTAVPPPTPAPAATSAPVAPTATPTTVPAAATLPPSGPVVTIIGRVAPCDYGSECLLAGFTIHNFATQPTEFVCEFSDGSRYTFHFNRQAVERACATGDPTDSITIEVAGIRSETYVHP